MPHCYLIALCTGSSLDQQSNNISLFSLVEQINVPPGAPPPPNNLIPLEVHAYFSLTGAEIGSEIEMRFALSGDTGLEAFSEPSKHRITTGRYRTRTVGLPYPAALGHYFLRVDFRMAGTEEWHRDPLRYPISFLESRPQNQVTH